MYNEKNKKNYLRQQQVCGIKLLSKLLQLKVKKVVV